MRHHGATLVFVGVGDALIEQTKTGFAVVTHTHRHTRKPRQQSAFPRIGSHIGTVKLAAPSLRKTSACPPLQGTA